MIEIGKSYTIEQVVTPEMTARAIGSGGLEVFGTPFMMAMMEHAAMDCVQPDLPEARAPWAWTFIPATWPPPPWA